MFILLSPRSLEGSNAINSFYCVATDHRQLHLWDMLCGNSNRGLVCLCGLGFCEVPVNGRVKRSVGDYGWTPAENELDANRE